MQILRVHFSVKEITRNVIDFVLVIFNEVEQLIILIFASLRFNKNSLCVGSNVDDIRRNACRIRRNVSS